MLIKQNQKLQAVWLDAQQFFEEELRHEHAGDEPTTKKMRDCMTSFVLQHAQILDRWTQAMCHEENNIVGALGINQIIKNLIIKIDQVLATFENSLESDRLECMNKIMTMKNACKEKLQDLMIEYQFKYRRQEETIAELTKKLEQQQKHMSQLQEAIGLHQSDVSLLTSKSFQK